jgi:uncharacterized DUF497 family protein
MIAMEFARSASKRIATSRRTGLISSMRYASLKERHTPLKTIVSPMANNTLGLLAGVPVSIAHTETKDEIKIISFRKATKREAELFFGEI